MVRTTYALAYEVKEDAFSLEQVALSVMEVLLSCERLLQPLDDRLWH